MPHRAFLGPKKFRSPVNFESDCTVPSYYSCSSQRLVVSSSRGLCPGWRGFFLWQRTVFFLILASVFILALTTFSPSSPVTIGISVFTLVERLGVYFFCLSPYLVSLHLPPLSGPLQALRISALIHCSIGFWSIPGFFGLMFRPAIDVARLPSSVARISSWLLSSTGFPAE